MNENELLSLVVKLSKMLAAKQDELDEMDLQIENIVFYKNEEIEKLKAKLEKKKESKK